MESWYIARSRPQKESSLQSFLEHHRVPVYYPRILRPGSSSFEPLFPGYLFCQFDPRAPVAPIIRWAPGLAYVLSADGQPLPVPHSLVEEVRQRVTAWNSGRRYTDIARGTPVRVVRGPLMGLEGVFQSYIPARQRCRILLQTVGRLTVVELPRRDLEPKLHSAQRSFA